MLNKKEIQKEAEKYKGCVVLVEGKKDVLSLRALGFENVYTIHRNKISIRERVEEIVGKVGREKAFCVLTDLDETGEKFYNIVTRILQELGVTLEKGLRDLLVESGVSHVEGFATFFED